MSTLRKFIFDTDIGPDYDDCGALAIIDRYHQAGKIELLGVTHCTSDLNSINAIAAINNYFDVSVPIGQTLREGFLTEHTYFTLPLSEFYLKEHPAPAYEPAVPLMRRLLAQNRNVTIVCVGPLSNMADLLTSGPDEISPLTGEELVRQSVDAVFVMGGHFGDFTTAEWNIKMDIPSAQIMSEKCAAPITYCGFEVGVDVITGTENVFADCDDVYPVKYVYNLCSQGKGRCSWDLITVYYALEPLSDDWILSDEKRIRFNADGSANVSEGTGARYVSHSAPDVLKDILNKIIGLNTI